MRRISFAMFVAVIWLLASTIPVVGASITVNASCSLADAITAANTDTATGGCIAGTAGSDTITITQAGTTSGTITLSATLAVNGTNSQESIIVLAGGGFTVSGNDSVRVFQVQEHGNLSISNLTITNGSAGNGGGVRVESGGVLTLNNVVIKDSEATSATGGGLRNQGTLTMSNSEIHSNSSATHGGGLDLRGTVNITSSIIRNNSTAAGQYGGGVYVTGNSQNISIQTSSIYGNSVGNGFGGGIFVNSASPFVVKNSTIYDNRAGSGGGGIYHNGGTSNFTHVTIAFNRSSFTGAGISRNTGTVRLRNSIVAGSTSLNGNNRKGDCNGTIGEMTDTLIQDNNCSPTHSGDPLLASAAAGSPPYYALQDGSPAIGEGNATYCAEVGTDQRGEARPATDCDLGAFEHPSSGTAPTDTPGPPTDTPVPTATDTPVPTATDTPTPTDTSTPTATATYTATPAATDMSVPLQDTPTPMATDTPVPLLDTATPSATATFSTSTLQQQDNSEPIEADAQSSANRRSVASSFPSATPTTGPSTGELLVNQGYQLSATHGLGSGIQFQRAEPSAIGIQSVLDMGYLDAIDVWGWVSQGAEVCFPQKGDIVFIDASTAPRTVTTIPFTYENGFTCAHLSGPGTVVLVSQGPATPTFSNVPVVLSGCTITTTDLVNMRNAPNGDQVLLVFLPETVFAALERVSGWFQVQFNGTLGWISADFVTTSGNCG